MLLKNCNIIFLDRIEKGSILIENNKIKSINPKTSNDINVIDCKGLYVSPGFIDSHIHGAGGYDTMDGCFESINEISKTICKFGTTSFTPTTMTMSSNAILKAMNSIKLAKINGTDGAEVLGAHLEGPFINLNAIGAQNPNYLLSPTLENFESMTKDTIDTVISITIAPEIEGAKELANSLTKMGIRCSMGHTKATYDEAISSIDYGFCHSTHLFNAMTGFTHREPGVVGATFDSDISTETISDGIHISYPALRVCYKQKGTDKVLLITDAMSACGMPDGYYSLGGQPVIVKNGAARLKNGALAGSVLTLNVAIKNIFENTNYPLFEIVKMATYNPAKYCKVDDRKGLIKEDFDADITIFDNNFNVKMTIVGGKIVYNNL